MIDRSRRLAEPLHWGRREKAVVGVLLACVALALAGLGAYALTSGSAAPKSCVDVTFASTVGAATPHVCGARARALCASGAFASGEAELRAACLRAGFPFRPRS
ncbi:MAG TPA: hypothetical protein VNZ05_07415 [Solirubrobacteraceae bacterium]|nr:hypothetical protein [Solirubrobacteraceae bacterium]